MRRLLPLSLLLTAAGCSRGEAPVQAPPAPAPAPAQAPGDAPLPAEDEVPAFLRGAAPPPDAAPAPDDPPVPDLPVEVELDEAPAAAWAAEEAPQREPTLAELMRAVTVEGEDAPGGDEESWAFIGGGDAPEAETEAEAPPPVEPAAAAEEEAAVVLELEDAPGDDTVAIADPAPAADPCAPLRRLLARRNDYVRRAAAERDAFGYVENEDDIAALRLLQGLRRCAEHPDDEDCRQKPIEVDVSDLEVPAHQIHRQPSDLNAEGKLPDEIPHDPVVLDLLHQLRACEKREVVQPLLQPSAARSW